jgi:hypothetical protein
VGKVTYALKRFRRKLLSKRNACFLPTPEVVFCVRTKGFNEANSLNLFDYRGLPGDRIPAYPRMVTRYVRRTRGEEISGKSASATGIFAASGGSQNACALWGVIRGKPVPKLSPSGA